MTDSENAGPTSETRASRAILSTVKMNQSRVAAGKRIWIDLDNSPHVPFFLPIIEELKKLGYEVVLTGRDCFQVRELVELHHLDCKMVGHHSGKLRIRKLLGLGARALQMAPFVRSQKPALALSHCSRSQLVLASLLGIPSLLISDYEHSTGWAFVKPTWFMHPDVISSSAFNLAPQSILRYPGIKEDVYVPRFRPDPSLQTQLGLQGGKLIVTLRPPAEEAHYHRPESDRLFSAVMARLKETPNTKVILLPRNGKQENAIRQAWPELFASEQFIVPAQVMDGLNLIWYSDLVISGGGTMNREAAALGVPVFSIFRGKIGSVDKYLAQQGRLSLVESVEEVQTKIRLTPRNRASRPDGAERPALQSIVHQIVGIMEGECQTKLHKAS
jgi:uncharacterized protein